MKILIVDDEKMIRELVKKYAVFSGHAVIEASDGMEAVDAVRRDKAIDIVVMDVMMPELDGFSAVREIRKFSDVPVVMLSARGEEYDRIHGFELGIDDYVVKPFSPRELVMRLEAVCRRGKAAGGASHDVFTDGGLSVDFTARLVTIDGEKRDLSPKEYDLLFYLVRNRGLALTREQLISEVWGYDYYGDDRTLDTHIKLLRKNLGPYQNKIVTLRGVGYRFEG
ncbi:MAG: response regulator transcription factor [Clostridia bacterium]|nr:response regulator transcription factor [Clostridia bacterium]